MSGFPRDLVRPDAVAFLADAYRHRHSSAMAALVVEHRHADYSARECELALAQVRIEAEAELIGARALRAVLRGEA